MLQGSNVQKAPTSSYRCIGNQNENYFVTDLFYLNTTYRREHIPSSASNTANTIRC